MSSITRRQALAAGAVGGAAALTGCPPAQAAKHPRASKVLDAMEGFRKKIPDDTRELFAGTGMSVEGMEPYTMPHLDQVAEGLGVGTRKECLMLLTYLKDADLKLRYIAVRAIDRATDAYPGGLSVEGITDTGSEAHRKMLFRFLEVIEKLPA
jgi:hypothetical protein